MISRKMKIPDFHKISYVLVSIDTVIVGVAGSLPTSSKCYISILYKFQKLAVSRFVDVTINELKINYFTF